MNTLQWMRATSIPGAWRLRLNENTRIVNDIGQTQVVTHLIYHIQQAVKQKIDKEISWKNMYGDFMFLKPQEQVDCIRTVDIICILGFQTAAYYEFLELVVAYMTYNLEDSTEGNRETFTFVYKPAFDTTVHWFGFATLSWIFMRMVERHPSYISS